MIWAIVALHVVEVPKHAQEAALMVFLETKVVQLIKKLKLKAAIPKAAIVHQENVGMKKMMGHAPSRIAAPD